MARPLAMSLPAVMQHLAVLEGSGGAGHCFDDPRCL
jgi:hypothetical protein